MSRFLDTDTCIFALRGNASVADELHRLSPEAIKIASIVQAELLLGAEKSRARKRTYAIVEAFLWPFEIVPFGARAAAQYARVRAALEARGERIGPKDLVLAATALAHDGTLVTHNTREFGRIPSLQLEDWVR